MKQQTYSKLLRSKTFSMEVSLTRWVNTHIKIDQVISIHLRGNEWVLFYWEYCYESEKMDMERNQSYEERN